MTSYPSYETLKVERLEKNPAVLHVQLNRPSKLNAMNMTFWQECKELFEKVNEDEDTRVVVLSGNGRLFTSGLDLSDSGSVFGSTSEDHARKAFRLRKQIMKMQGAFTAIEEAKQPVIAAIHSGCIGGGVDLVCACDIRLCAGDAFFSIKEVDVGLAADVGTLQRMPKIMGNEGLIRELAYTARLFPAAEAHSRGFVAHVYETRQQLMLEAFKMAEEIASKSPVALYGTKRFLNHARDHSVAEGLEYAATWNVSMLASEDLPIAIHASLHKKRPLFAKL